MSVASVVVLVAIGLLVWTMTDRNESAAALGSSEARDVASALERLETDPDSLVASSARSRVGDQATAALPPDADVKPQVATWAPDGAGGGTMAVMITAPGQGAATFLAVMVSEEGSWKVLATFGVEDTAEPTEEPS